MNETFDAAARPGPVTGFDQVETAARTDVGIRRSHNQDAYELLMAGEIDRWREQGHLFIVADGMGGHAVGEKASAKAVRDIPHTYRKHAAESPEAALRKAFVEANAGIHSIGQENPEFRGLGTTATALLIRPDGAWLGHVGDSRAYRIRPNLIEQLTFDHSAVWELARRQRVQPEDLPGIRSNVILRSLGPEPTVDVDVEGPHPVHPGDTFLICSDGLTGQVSDYEIGAVVNALPPTEASDFLVELANLRGGPDNTTVIIVRAGPAGAAADPAGPAPTVKLARPPSPWPLSALAVGVVLAISALMLLAAEWPGSSLAFAVAAGALAAGLFGLLLHSKRLAAQADGVLAEPRINVYRSTRCQVERPLLDKLIAAEESIRQRLAQDNGAVITGDFAAIRRGADERLAAGDLGGAFREHCRAAHVLIRQFNKLRQKEEVFQPVWDKFAGG